MNWIGLHCFHEWNPGATDEFLTGSLAPLLSEMRLQAAISDWFFIRYAEGGPHLRVRVRGAGPQAVEQITKTLSLHGEVRQVDYEPEIDRYGGPDAIAVAEEVFCRSTETAIALIATTAPGKSRFTAAAELAIATAHALGLDRLTAARWLRSHAAGWQRATELDLPPAINSHARAARILAAQGEELGLRWTRPAARTQPWMVAVQTARAQLNPGASEPGNGRWWRVWGSQLHMLFNRLGLHPEEERTLCLLLAGVPVVSFFADGPLAPDRHYQEASKFLPGLDEQRPQQVSPVTTAPPGRRVELAPPGAVTTTLAEAMRRRATGRGRMAGPVSSGDLATLLWTAQGIVQGDDGTRHRSYPSAGAKYPARLRLIALDVQGLESGCYDVDAVGQALWRVGPPPATRELRGMSDFFGARGNTEISELPALLVLHVQSEEIRRRYGLRGLRFALTEAGHLAQNLALTAAATGLSLGMIGGFYDDVVAEVAGLSALDTMPVYLLPLGRRAFV